MPRPRTLTKAKKEILIANIRNLSGRVGAADALGINYHTLLNWLKVDEEFRIEFEKAELETLQRGKQIAIKSIFKAMDKSWQAAAWWLERTLPNEYAKRDKVDMDITEKKVVFQIGITDPKLLMGSETEDKLIEEQIQKKIEEKRNEDLEGDYDDIL